MFEGVDQSANSLFFTVYIEKMKTEDSALNYEKTLN